MTSETKLKNNKTKEKDRVVFLTTQSFFAF